MTSPNIKMDPAAVAEAAAQLRGISAATGTALDPAAAAVSAAAAAPLQGGSTEGPEVAVVTGVMDRLRTEMNTATDELADSSAKLEEWSAGLGDIQRGGADEVAWVGGGGTF